MTVFSASDIPPTVDSYEKLAVWLSTVLNDLYPTLTIVEGAGAGQRAAQSAPFLISNVDPPTWRCIGRFSIELDANWRSSGKIWEHAKPLGTAAIPAAYKA